MGRIDNPSYVSHMFACLAGRTLVLAGSLMACWRVTNGDTIGSGCILWAASEERLIYRATDETAADPGKRLAEKEDAARRGRISAGG